jgi:hypothetical protein
MYGDGGCQGELSTLPLTRIVMRQEIPGVVIQRRIKGKSGLVKKLRMMD